jgi:two-component system, cell cycle response regulator DivK
MILQVEGDTMRHVAKYGRLRAMRGAGDTFPLSRDWVGGRAVIDGKTVHVHDLTDDAYVVSVTDTGPGIAEADREKIFEEFQQADTTRAKTKGGTRSRAGHLATHRRDARRAALGRLHARRRLDVLVHGAHPRRAPGGGSARGRAAITRRILVVDDQEDNRRILRDLLTASGFEVIEGKTGEEGVALAGERAPDLILMDIQLPGIDGYEATRRIKAKPALSATALIVVTSYALSGDDAKAFTAGADAYVSKPFSPRALLAKVREFLGPA